MWKEEFEPRGPKGSNDQGQQDPNFGRLLAVGIAVAMALAFASTAPGPLVAMLLSDFLLFGVFGALFIAALRQDQLFANEITAWDQAAVLLLFSLLCGFFVDPETVSETLNAMIGDSSMTPA